MKPQYYRIDDKFVLGVSQPSPGRYQVSMIAADTLGWRCMPCAQHHPDIPFDLNSPFLAEAFLHSIARRYRYKPFTPSPPATKQNDLPAWTFESVPSLEDDQPLSGLCMEIQRKRRYISEITCKPLRGGIVGNGQIAAALGISEGYVSGLLSGRLRNNGVISTRHIQAIIRYLDNIIAEFDERRAVA